LVLEKRPFLYLERNYSRKGYVSFGKLCHQMSFDVKEWNELDWIGIQTPMNIDHNNAMMHGLMNETLVSRFQRND